MVLGRENAVGGGLDGQIGGVGYIQNREALLGSGDAALRATALHIAEAGILAADPAHAVRQQVSLAGDLLRIAGRTYDLAQIGRVFVIGAGKATFPIAAALDDILGDRITRGLVACKRGQHGEMRHIEMAIADHPVPSADSRDVARRTVELLDGVRPGDLVLACFTGGSSALFVEPAEGVSLDAKAEANRLLLACGANILEINAVRKHISRVKGGRLARRLPAATRLVNLTVSDVIGDPLDYITCPTVPDTASFADACATLDRYGLWERMPRSIVAHLRAAPSAERSVPEAGLAHLDRHDALLVTTDAACVGAAVAAQAAGFRPLILSTSFEGESSALGRSFAAMAREIIVHGRPLPKPCALIGGGETTVTLTDRAGRGGPNQEFAVAAALDLQNQADVVALGLDTDGTDGPTRYAGAIADGATVAIARSRGVDLEAALRAHDVTPALERCGHAVMTGHTGTNVNDLKLVLIGRPPR